MALILGIDASNLRRGGGRTHLIEILKGANPQKSGLDKVIVWGSTSTMNLIENNEWLIKINPRILDKEFIFRSLWSLFLLSKSAKKQGCDLLFIPGGTYLGSFRPFVTMSRNLLPFEKREIDRYKGSLLFIKLLLLRFFQSVTFKKASGIIFLTEYAKQSVQKTSNQPLERIVKISHGLNLRFVHEPKEQIDISAYSKKNPFSLIYVSIIDHYKHQWNVVEAVGYLRIKYNWHLELNLIGPYYTTALAKLIKAIEKWDPEKSWVKYHGEVSYHELHRFYQNSNLGIFASSCENMPNILLETMAAGLPIACSSCGPMPEILKDGGLYFNPESPKEIEETLEKLIKNKFLRKNLSIKSYNLALNYNWTKTAEKTLEFLNSILIDFKKSSR